VGGREKGGYGRKRKGGGEEIEESKRRKGERPLEGEGGEVGERGGRGEEGREERQEWGGRKGGE